MRTMELTRRHLGVAVLLAAALHGMALWWYALPSPEPWREPARERPLHISLLAEAAQVAAALSPPQPAPRTETPSEAVVPEPEPAPAPLPERPEPISPSVPLEKPVPEPPALEEPPSPNPTLPEPVRAEPMPPVTETVDAPIPEPLPEPHPEPLQAERQEAGVADVPVLDHEALARYEELIVAWLEKHKKYPRRARRLRIEGEGLLRIIIDRGGRLQAVDLARRTGNRLLDKAAVEMARRAAPFPPLPADDPSDQREFVVPVAFVLR